MGNTESEDPLTRHTARLSISKADQDPGMVRDMLRAEVIAADGEGSRRGSVISFDDEKQPSLQNRSKRRRSSAHQAAMTPPPAKKEKIHKRKQKKSLPPKITFKNDVSVTKLPFKRLRDLVCKVFNAAGDKSKWYDLTNPNNISGVVVCLASGLDTKNFPIKETSTLFKPVVDNAMFDVLFPTMAPGSTDSIYPSLTTILNLPLTKKERTDMVARSKAQMTVITDLLLTKEQMVQNYYPMEIADGWVASKSFSHEGSTIFALDCEMCLAGTEKVLTRLSLVNFQGETVIDEYINPEVEITDYVTQYSGITREILEGVTTTRADIQKRLLEIVSDEDILIGHSLESDLRAIKWIHPKVVDTSVCYDHARGPPAKPSLKWLATQYLDRYIQSGEATGKGHSSVEDALACMDLVKAQIANGKLFGRNISEISIFERLRTVDPEFKGMTITYPRPRQLPSDSDLLKSVHVANDDEVVRHYLERDFDPKLVVMNLRQLEFSRGWSTAPGDFEGDVLDVSVEDANTRNRIQQIYDDLPANTLFIVYSTVNAPQPMYELQQRRKEWKRMDKEGVDLSKVPEEQRWTPETIKELAEATRIAREGVSFVTIKGEGNKI